MSRFLYRLLLLALVPALVFRLLWRARKQPEYLHHLPERFGFYSSTPSPARDGVRDDMRPPLVWLHCVSVGEVRAAQPLLEAFRARRPGHRLLVTCMTPTGRAAAQESFGALASVVYLPYDFVFSQRRFLRHWQPALGLLLETELWPNLLAEAARAQVPVVLVNARLSPRSALGYQRFASLLRPAIASLAGVAAQTTDDGERIKALGAREVVVCGNLKFEVTPQAPLLALGKAWRDTIGVTRPVWLAASTRQGEEAIVLDAWLKLARPEVLLLLVPRHPQRFDEVAALVAARGLRLQRRSAAVPDATTQVWLGDSMGEMAAFFAAADFCVIGGSLLPFGSQNLIEACACDCPVLIGPSDFNFAQAAADALASGAARRIAGDVESLASAAARLLDDANDLATMRAATRRFAAAHRGACLRTLAVIEHHLGA